ncbi:MAG TPA: phospholipase D-like domain-containing protein [Myxococcota bacterium]|nr:phospholipase D-like domain-containing protein [Myxococcota bacterium]
MSIRLTALAPAFALLFAACDAPLDASGRELATRVGALVSTPASAEVEFTDPGTSSATARDTLADDRIMAAIDGASQSVDIAVFGFDHPGITQATLRAHARGVAVRVVGHGEQLATSDGLKALQAAGVPMSLRSTSSLMHHKFMVIDGLDVAFGSMNFTTYAATQNDENLVFVRSPELAQIFTAELAQMFAGNFGARKVARLVRPEVAVEGGTIGLHFSPKEEPLTRLREVIATAETRIYFLAYSFTLPELADDLIAARARGVEVVGVFDKASASSSWSQDERLAAGGVDVSLDGNENTAGFAGGRLHHKVMIIDAGGSDPIVVTGSYNWSAAATTSNDETLAILRGASLVAPFVAEFCRVHGHSSATTVPSARAVPSLCIDRPLLAMTEVLANPIGTDRDEELLELVNVGTASVDLSGYTISDALAVRHVFAAGTHLAPHQALVVHAGPSTTAARLLASSGQLSLNNDTDLITLRSASGAIIDRVSLGLAFEGESIHRDPDALVDHDFDGLVDASPWYRHTELVPGIPTSPDLRPDGLPWALQSPGPVENPDEPEFSEHEVLITAALPNPVGADRPDEWVMIENTSLVAVDLSGWALGDLSSPHRHVFAAGTTLAPGATLTIYDGGVRASDLVASSGTLSLNNSAETLTLYDAHAAIVDTFSWGSAAEGVVIER